MAAATRNSQDEQMDVDGEGKNGRNEGGEVDTDDDTVSLITYFHGQ